MRRASGQAIIEAVLTLTLMLAACVGLIHAVLMAWWAIAMPLVHSELEREVLAKVGLVQLVMERVGGRYACSSTSSICSRLISNGSGLAMILK